MAKTIKISENDLVDIIKKILDNKTIDLENLMSLSPNTFSNISTPSNNSQSWVNKPSEMKITAKGQELLNNELFKQKIKEISNEIGVSEDSIIKLMKHESRLDSSIKNSLGCVGLIQFCPDNGGGSTKTINGKSYNLSDLQNDLELQLDAIKEFWSKGKRDGKIKDAKDLYIYNFFPIAAGKPDDYVLQTNKLSPEKIAKSNPVFNNTLGRPIDTPLTVGDLSNYYEIKGMV